MSILSKPNLPVVHKGHPLARGLKAAYPFFEGGGDKRLYDISGHGNHGTIQTAPTWAVNNPYGHSLSFNGTDTYISVPSIISSSDTELGFAALVKADTNSATYNVLSYSQDGVWFVIRLNNGSNDQVWINVYDGSNNIVSTTSFSTTEWLWVIGTATEGGSVELFVKGSSQGTTAITTFSTAAQLGRHIGVARDISFGGWLSGDIADIRIWNRRITEADALSIEKDPWGLYRVPYRRVRSNFVAVPLGEVSVVGDIGILADMSSVTTKEFDRSTSFGVNVELSGSITKDFRNVQTFRGAMGVVADLDGVVSAQFTREREGRIDVVAEFDSPVTFEKMKSGQIDAIVDLVASTTEGETPVTDQDIGEAIVFRVPKIDYVFRARKHPTGRRL